MRPMSLFELDASNGDISLSALMFGESASAPDPGLGLEDLTALICRGGWPAFRDLEVPQALRRVRSYLGEVPRDTERLAGNRPERITRLLESLARNVATLANATTLATDASRPEDPVSSQTVAGYLSSLTRLFVVEDQPAWQPHLRSRYRLRRAAKRHFVDPSLAVAALRADPSRLIRDLNFLGLLFESLVVRDLRVYSQPLDGEVQHYRDSGGLEVDAVVDLGNSWGAFEIKLGGTEAIDDAASALKKFAARVDVARIGPPAALAVIVASGYGYVREDGVQVIPIGCLGP